jgi:hypothetical protein
LIDIELARNEKEIRLEDLIRRIIQKMPVNKSSGVSLVGGAPVSSLRAVLEDLQNENKIDKTVRIRVQADIDSGILRTIIRHGEELVELFDLAIWLDHYGKVARQDSYPGQSSYIEECYEKIRKTTAQKSKKPQLTEIWRKNQILDTIKTARYTATELPKHIQGRSGMRNKIWKEIGWSPDERLAFNKAWQDLRDDGRIADATS